MSRVEVRTNRHDGTPRVIFGEPGFGCFIECEYTQPPSMEGRKINVYVPSSVIPALMKDFRTIAIRDRSGTIGERDV